VEFQLHVTGRKWNRRWDIEQEETEATEREKPLRVSVISACSC
jgi:hypothetical protein